jgi:hypothetical protein
MNRDEAGSNWSIALAVCSLLKYGKGRKERRKRVRREGSDKPLREI